MAWLDGLTETEFQMVPPREPAPFNNAGKRRVRMPTFVENQEKSDLYYTVPRTTISNLFGNTVPKYCVVGFLLFKNNAFLFTNIKGYDPENLPLLELRAVQNNVGYCAIPYSKKAFSST